MIKITALSDLHGDMPELKGGDLLIIAGDLTARDRPADYETFANWLKKQPYKKKVIVAGNHDMLIEKAMKYPGPYQMPALDAEYLCDSGVEYCYEEEVEEEHKFRGLIKVKQQKKLKLWGTPWTQWFHGVNPDYTAFMLRSEFQLQDRFNLIPDDTDILISHSPCFGRLDQTLYGERVGSRALLDKVDYLRTKGLRYHFHGHIHEGYGMYQDQGFKAYNVARMDKYYIPKNPIVNI